MGDVVRVGHTKGEWRLDVPDGSGVLTEDYHRIDAGRGFHEGEDGGFSVTGYMNPADARLIAAAPLLLEAAKLALGEAESWIHDQLDGTSSLESALKALDPVREAIAAATGSAGE